MRTPKVWRLAIAAGMLAMLSTAPAIGAPGGTKVLGTDAQNDAPPGGDLLALEVAQHGRDLHVRIVQSTIPSVGSYPQAGIQWSFTSRARTFAVEAHQESPGAYGFTLYEIKGGTFNVVDEIEGDLEDGAFNMYVPLTAISATKGTIIKGALLSGADADVEIHQHATVTSQIVDSLLTDKPFKVR
jgi:hypothetical protein